MEKFEQQLKPGGLLIIDSSLISIKPTRTDIKFIPMKASDIASELGKDDVRTYIDGRLSFNGNRVFLPRFV